MATSVLKRTGADLYRPYSIGLGRARKTTISLSGIGYYLLVLSSATADAGGMYNIFSNGSSVTGLTTIKAAVGATVSVQSLNVVINVPSAYQYITLIPLTSTTRDRLSYTQEALS